MSSPNVFTFPKLHSFYCFKLFSEFDDFVWFFQDLTRIFHEGCFFSWRFFDNFLLKGTTSASSKSKNKILSLEKKNSFWLDCFSIFHLCENGFWLKRRSYKVFFFKKIQVVFLRCNQPWCSSLGWFCLGKKFSFAEFVFLMKPCNRCKILLDDAQISSVT